MGTILGMVRCRRGVTLLALVLAVALVAAVPADAAAPTTGDPVVGPESPRSEPTPGRADTIGPPTTSEASDELSATVARDGHVRVVVELDVAFEPEGNLEGPGMRRQRAEIARGLAALRRELRGSAHRELRTFDTLPHVVLTVDEDGLERLRRSGHVAGVAEDEVLEPSLRESSPIVQADRMWDDGFSGAGYAVAVLDTGVDTSHSFFGGRVVEEACYSTNGADTTSLCPNGSSSQTGTGAGVHCTGPGCGHGTHVAGIAGGRGASFSGVARGANLMSVQVFSRTTSGQLTAYASDVAAGLERVYERRSARNIVAANLSLGGGRHTSSCDGSVGWRPIRNAVENLRSVDVATIVATGNDGWHDSVAAPACLSQVVAVGSTTKTDQLSVFSNNHPTMVDLLAPGTAITSSRPGGLFGPGEGTSMAAPHVAGAWALLREFDPTASVSQIRAALAQTGLPVAETHRNSSPYTQPRIRISEASSQLEQTAYVSLTPKRVLDSRDVTGDFSSPVGRRQTKRTRVAGVGGVPSDAAAVVINVAGVDPTANTFLTVWPTGESWPVASTLNLTKGQNLANMIVAKVGSDGRVDIYNHNGSTDVVFDVVGYMPAG
jgi:subtilisin